MTPRNNEVARHFALLWESQVGYEAMVANERGDYAGASRMVYCSVEPLAEFADGTGVRDSIVHKLKRAERKVSRAWDGRSKRDAMIAAAFKE